jgi:hypothetical protein
MINAININISNKNKHIEMNSSYRNRIVPVNKNNQTSVEFHLFSVRRDTVKVKKLNVKATKLRGSEIGD